MINPQKLKHFLSKVFREDQYIFDDVIRAADTFYSYLAARYPDETEDHLNIIRNFTRPTIDELAGKMRTMIRAGPYRKSTVGNYCTIIQKYLEHLGRMPTIDDKNKIEAYIIHLHNDRNLSARTVNLVTAGIDLFYTTILKFPDSTKDVQRPVISTII